jgi:phytoene synthase
MTVQPIPQPAWETTLLDWAQHALMSAAPTHTVAADDTALCAAYEYCALITREASKTFFLASGLLPADKRRAARALYAFCRVTDNIVDESEVSPAETLAALDVWRRQTLDPHHAPTLRGVESFVALAWADARARCQIPVGYAEQLIAGVARDLDTTRYSTFDELAAYAYGVASTVGLMAMHIIGFAGEHALPYAVKLGVALQITNILRDVGEDWGIGRVYLPADDLAAFDLTADDIAAGVRGQYDDRWRAFMRFQIARNRQLYDEGMPGIALLNAEGRFAISAASELYRAILTDIEAHDYNVFNRRSHIPMPGKVRRLPGIWWRSRMTQL